jgi:tRNA-dihydrouridine synthase
MADFLWNNLPKPFTALAPMEDVTDTVFRQVVSSVGKPDLFFTEFVSTDGFCSKARDKMIPRLKFLKSEKPIIAQIWGNDPQKFEETAREISKMGFDGVDINMGCPDKNVVKKGAGGGLIGNYVLAEKIIKATKKGAGKLPVSVKTRIGIKEVVTTDWISFLLKQDLSAIILHGRTVKEMSNIPANWNEIALAVKIRDKINPKTLIIGNGDVKSFSQATEYSKKYGVDGIMIGRGILHNPWVFNPKVDINKVTPKQRLELLEKHIKLFKKTWKNEKNYDILKKFYKAYINDFKGAKSIRIKLMETNDCKSAIATLESFL